MAAAVGVGSLAYGIVKSENQKSQANKIARENQFKQETMPDEQKQATTLAAQNYINGMPGMSYAQNQINQGAANAQAYVANGATSGADILDSANKINYQSNLANNQLSQQAALYKSNALGQYENQLGNQAQWQDKLYQNNELQPYLRAANTAASLQGAANINEANAIDNGLVSAQTAIQNYQQQQKFNVAKNNPYGSVGVAPAFGAATSLSPYGGAFDAASALAQSKYYKLGS